jgi:hypothetical protein
MGFDLNQFCEHIKASTIVGANELWKGSKTCPPVLKVDFEATVVMEIAKTSRAIWAITRNLVEFTFHQFKILKLTFIFSISSIKYQSSSDLLSTSLLEAQYFWNLLMKWNELSLLSLLSIMVDKSLPLWTREELPPLLS